MTATAISEQADIAERLDVAGFASHLRSLFPGKYFTIPLPGGGTMEYWAPETWHQNSVRVMATKYSYGGDMSVHDVCARVVLVIAEQALKQDYVHSIGDARDFALKLADNFMRQRAMWNSPVEFNVGRKHKPQVSACFINGLFDSMDSIRMLQNTESLIFTHGSGAGTNYFRLRGEGEPLSPGGTSSGVMPFIRQLDAQAGAIKSGGTTRRAAKMVILNIEHPDIEQFIDSKRTANRAGWDLLRAGYDIGINGKDEHLVPYQNANHSVRVTNEFMDAVRHDADWSLISPLTQRVVKTVRAKDLWADVVDAAWASADPGIQFHDTINTWHTVKADGPIVSSNPCSEYMFLEETACNLASLNVMQYSRPGEFLLDIEDVIETTRLFARSMDVLVDFAYYPDANPLIETQTRKYRTLGYGYSNVGAWLMANGIAYDSEEGRDAIGAVTALINASVARESAQIARELGPYERWSANRESHLEVAEHHLRLANASCAIATSSRIKEIWTAAEELYTEALELAEQTGFRNAQWTVIAPTGTIGIAMGCETTGVEPLYTMGGIEKTLVGGGTMDVSGIKCVAEGVATLRRELELTVPTDAQIIASNPDVFAAATGWSSLEPESHVRAVAAAQRHISGAISKTVNMPTSATREDVENVYLLAHSLDVKAVALYRDKCKYTQPMNEVKTDEQMAADVAAMTTADEVIPYLTSHGLPASVDELRRLLARTPRGARRVPPDSRNGTTYKLRIGDRKLYVTLNRYPDTGELCEVFVEAGAFGTSLGGLLKALGIMVSEALQYGMPLAEIVKQFRFMDFSPQGIVKSDTKIKFASSIPDMIAQLLQGQMGEWEMTETVSDEYFDESLGKLIHVAFSLTDQQEAMQAAPIVLHTDARLVLSPRTDACPDCGNMEMIQSGSCPTCPVCGYAGECG